MFSVFGLYVAFRSQFATIAEVLEGLLINFFFSEEREQLSIQTVESLQSYVDERKYSSVSHEFEITEDKYQSFKQKIRYSKKRKNCTVLAGLLRYVRTTTSPSCWHSRE